MLQKLLYAAFVFYIWRMNMKWYLSTLLLTLSILGFNQKQAIVPNQEIIVQFAYEEVTYKEAQDAITIVKEQLRAVGVDNIQVQETSDGRLKIAYYSNIDILSIQKMFSEEDQLALSHTSLTTDSSSTGFPVDKSSKIYELNIYEIQDGNDFTSDFNKYALDLEFKSNRFIDSVVYFSDVEIDVQEKNKAEKTAYTLHKSNSIAIDNSLHNIPEVRAGPLS